MTLLGLLALLNMMYESSSTPHMTLMDVVYHWRAETVYDERPEQSYDTDHPHRHPVE